jgi:hypothetical protein
MNKTTTKNLHLEHPEDMVLTGNLEVLDWFSEPDSFISTKLDGSPSLVWGRNPANGKFFVGTKSVFNKVKIKINHSHEEIDANHEGKVADILHSCLDYLPRTDYIIQGDFIGYGGSDTYRPNTITYVFPEVVTQDIIVAPHTYYIAENDLRDAVAYPMDFAVDDTYFCKFVTPIAEICPYRDDIEDISKFAKQMSTLCEFMTPRKATEIKKVINSYIRKGIEVDEHEIAENYDVDINVLRLWKLVYSIKMDLFFFIEREDDIKCYIEDMQCDHEGYVMNNQFGMLKIVDRYQFSRANFIMEKNWI